jgi:hypothetical protein
MKIFRKVILFITFISPITAFGQGWVKEKGKGYFKVAQNIVSSDKYFAPNGNSVSTTIISQFGSSIYAEFGLTNKLTAVANIPFYVRQTINDVQFRQSGRILPGDDFGSIGDADLGVKYAFSQDKAIVLSTSLILGLPLGKTNGGSSGILQTGDGEFNQLIRFDASHSFYPKPIYVNVYSGFNNRTKDFSDEVRYGFEIGFPFKKFIPIVKVNGLASLKNGEALSAQGSLFANNIEFLSPSLDLNYQISSKIGVSAAVAVAVYGRNVLNAPYYNFGVFMKW